MKSGWTRDRPEIELDGPAIAELVAPLFPGSSVAGYARVAGGLINTNIKVTTSGRAKPVLLRLYQRDPASARKEVAVTARIAGAVPVAPFLYFSEHNSITGRPYAIAEWIDGEPLDRIVASLDRQAITTIGHSLGHALAAIHEFTFDRPGFFAGDLSVPEAIDLCRSGLLAYLQKCIVEGPGAARLGADLTAALLSFAEREGELLDSWLDPPSLVHGDFNGPNILLRRSSLGRQEAESVVTRRYG